MRSQKMFYMILVLGCVLPLTLPHVDKVVLKSQVAKIENETKTTKVVTNEPVVPQVAEAVIPVAKVKEPEPEVVQVIEVPKKEVKEEIIQTIEQVQESKPEAEIVYDGMTLDQLSTKLDKSLKSVLAGKGSLYASYSLQMGVDPYVALAITLHETGCNGTCSKLVRECNNVGGMKGSPGCNGGSYKKFETIDEGIKAYIDNLSKNYYKKGLDTVEEINTKYAASTTWSGKIYYYIDLIKSR